jgi:hypothetical protein
MQNDFTIEKHTDSVDDEEVFFLNYKGVVVAQDVPNSPEIVDFLNRYGDDLFEIMNKHINHDKYVVQISSSTKGISYASNKNSLYSTTDLSRAALLTLEEAKHLVNTSSGQTYCEVYPIQNTLKHTKEPVYTSNSLTAQIYINEYSLVGLEEKKKKIEEKLHKLKLQAGITN